MSCFRKDLKRGDKHLVNTLDQMLETLLGVVGNATEFFGVFLFCLFLPSVEFTIHLGRKDSLRKPLTHNSSGPGNWELEHLGS